MQAKRRTLLVLLALAALAGAALFLVRLAGGRAEGETPPGIPLAGFDAADLTAITWTRAGQTVALSRSGSGWALAGDPAYHIDQARCDELARTLAGLAAGRRLDPQPGEDYGLAQPSLTVSATAAGQTFTFIFGAVNAVTGDIYLQREGDSAVYTAASSAADAFAAGREELFEPFNPAGIDAGSLERISYTGVDAAGAAFTVRLEAVSVAERTGSYATVWRLADDPDAELDQDAVREILSALGGQATGQHTGADPAEYGFDAPAAVVTASDGQAEYRLTYAAGADGWYMMVEGDGSVYEVPAAMPQAFSRTAAELCAGAGTE